MSDEATFSETKSAVFTACRVVMKALARFLIRNGMSYQELAEVSKWAFVSVAAEDYGIAGRKTNVSRISILTGLPRKEVNRLRASKYRQVESVYEWKGRAGSLLVLWQKDPEFCDEEGQPRPLPYNGGGVSFSKLAKKAGTDLPAKALLKELLRVEAVEFEDNGLISLKKKYFTPHDIDPKGIEYYGITVSDLMETMNYNLSSSDPHRRIFEATAWVADLPEDAFPRFERYVRERGTSVLESCDDWLQQFRNRDESNNARNVRAGLSVFAFKRVLVERGKQPTADGGS